MKDGTVCSVIERIDAVRREFVLNVFCTVTSDETQACLMADVLPAMLIGSATVLPRLLPERVLDLYKDFKRLRGLGDPVGKLL